ncbi:MAG TPA: outer membrane lipoprotein carrier protein LolA [Xanthobacteraceae bacterium]
MRKAGLAALVAALLAGGTSASAAQNVPMPVPAPKKPQATAQSATQAPRPPASIGPGAAAATPQTSGTGGLDANQRALVDHVSAYLSSVQTLVGDFVQVGPDGQRTEGQFFIQKPGKVRFEYNPPSPVDVVADGQSVVVRDRRLDTQQLFSLSQTPLRFLLSDHIDLLHDTKLVSVSADDTFVTVVIEETQTLVGTSRLMLMVGAKDFQLRQWTVTDPQGFDTTVAVYNLDTTKKPDPSMFKITYADRPDPR